MASRPGLPARRGTIYLLVATGVLGLAALNFAGWWMLRGLERDLLHQIDRQLRTTSRLVADQIGRNYLLDEWALPLDRPATVLQIERELFDIRQRSRMETLFLLSPDRTALLDYRFETADKSPSRAFPLSETRFTAAIDGDSLTVDRRTLDDQLFLTTYTPVRNIAGDVVAVLVADAPADLFTRLQAFGTRLVLMGLAGLAILSGFGGIIILAIRRLLQGEARLREQAHLAQLGEMAAMVAHEIRNPLSIIKGSADVLRKKYAGESNELFEFIPEEIDRLNRLINDFLQFARQRDLPLDSADPVALIAEIVDRYADPRLRLEAERGESIPLNSDAFRQILLNVIDNARQATPADGVITVRASREGRRRYRITVTDSGAGMPEAVRARVFDPFFSTRATGSGLGLAITRRLITQMGGTIVVASRDGAGTTVTVDLPR